CKEPDILSQLADYAVEPPYTFILQTHDKTAVICQLIALDERCRRVFPLRPPVIPLTDFQRAWIDDNSRFKIAVKSRRVGLTFAATLEIALDALARRTRWMIISPPRTRRKKRWPNVAITYNS